APGGGRVCLSHECADARAPGVAEETELPSVCRVRLWQDRRVAGRALRCSLERQSIRGGVDGLTVPAISAWSATAEPAPTRPTTTNATIPDNALVTSSSAIRPSDHSPGSRRRWSATRQ